MSKILGLTVLSAVSSGIVACGIHGTHDWPLSLGSFLQIAAVSWGLLLVVGIGGAWVLARLLDGR